MLFKYTNKVTIRISKMLICANLYFMRFCINMITYLRRHIYGELKSGDRNNARTMKWGFLKSARLGACQCHYMFFTTQLKIAKFMGHSHHRCRFTLDFRP